MRKSFRPTLLADGSALAALLLLLTTPLAMGQASAGPEVHRSHVIKVQANDAEVIEADVSHLLPGESEMIVTEDGTTVDLLRTEDGMEIWIDGELVHDGASIEAQVAHAHRLEEILGEHLADAEDIDMEFDFDIDVDCTVVDQNQNQDQGDDSCLHKVLVARHVDQAAVDALTDGDNVRVIRIEKHEEINEEIVD